MKKQGRKLSDKRALVATIIIEIVAISMTAPIILYLLFSNAGDYTFVQASKVGLAICYGGLAIVFPLYLFLRFTGRGE